jgi:hypothetical protein
MRRSPSASAGLDKPWPSNSSPTGPSVPVAAIGRMSGRASIAFARLFRWLWR